MRAVVEDDVGAEQEAARKRRERQREQDRHVEEQVHRDEQGAVRHDGCDDVDDAQSQIGLRIRGQGLFPVGPPTAAAPRVITRHRSLSLGFAYKRRAPTGLASGTPYATPTRFRRAGAYGLARGGLRVPAAMRGRLALLRL